MAEFRVQDVTRYSSITPSDHTVKEVGRYNDVTDHLYNWADPDVVYTSTQSSIISTWSVSSGLPIPPLCQIPDLVTPTVLPLNIREENGMCDTWDPADPTASGIYRQYQWAKEESFCMDDVDFLISRGIMKTLCSTPMKTKNRWRLLVFSINGRIHIEKVPQGVSEQAGQIMRPEAAAGKVFEDMLRTGGRRTTGYLCQDVDVRSVRRVSLGSLKIMTACKVSCQFPEETGRERDVIENYIEPKCVADGGKTYYALPTWTHCAPVGSRNVYLGFRDRSCNLLVGIKSTTVDEIAACGGRWSPEQLLSFLHDLLCWVKEGVEEGDVMEMRFSGRVVTLQGYHSDIEEKIVLYRRAIEY